MFRTHVRFARTEKLKKKKNKQQTLKYKIFFKTPQNQMCVSLFD